MRIGILEIFVQTTADSIESSSSNTSMRRRVIKDGHAHHRSQSASSNSSPTLETRQQSLKNGIQMFTFSVRYVHGGIHIRPKIYQTFRLTLSLKIDIKW